MMNFMGLSLSSLGLLTLHAWQIWPSQFNLSFKKSLTSSGIHSFLPYSLKPLIIVFVAFSCLCLVSFPCLLSPWLLASFSFSILACLLIPCAHVLEFLVEPRFSASLLSFPGYLFVHLFTLQHWMFYYSTPVSLPLLILSFFSSLPSYLATHSCLPE